MKEIFALTADCLDESGWIGLEKWMREPLRNIPISIRERDEGITHCNSIVAATGDTACDPRLGGVAGVKILAAFYGVGEQQFRRYILPNLTWIKWLGSKPITNVCSVLHDVKNYKANVSNIWLNNLN
tara:strand:+ start:50648 stop:51028 length:381 start_codon:yes stop_codon:yes gene_type:complete